MEILDSPTCANSFWMELISDHVLLVFTLRMARTQMKKVGWPKVREEEFTKVCTFPWMDMLNTHEQWQDSAVA